MRFTLDHKDRVRYWLTDAAGKSIIVLLNHQAFYIKIKTFMNNYTDLQNGVV